MTDKPRRPVHTITLPVERAMQLHALADKLGVTISEAIEELINEQISAGRIPDRLPGFDIDVLSNGVFFHAPRFALPILPPEAIRAIADVLNDVTDGERGKQVDFPRDGTTLAIARRGRGVLLVRTDAKGSTDKHSLTPGMARDLARQLRNAADQVSDTDR